MNPQSTVPFKGEALKVFLLEAHTVMAMLGSDPNQKNPICPYDESPANELELARKEGWLVGLRIRDAKDLHFGYAFDVLHLNEDDRTIMVWDGPNYDPDTAIIKHGPAVVRMLVEQYATDVEVYRVLEALDDVHQYLIGNVRALVRKDGNPSELLLYEKNAYAMKDVLQFMATQAEVPDATNFFDIIQAGLDGCREAMIQQVDERHS